MTPQERDQLEAIGKLAGALNAAVQTQSVAIKKLGTANEASTGLAAHAFGEARVCLAVSAVLLAEVAKLTGRGQAALDEMLAVVVGSAEGAIDGTNPKAGATVLGATSLLTELAQERFQRGR